MLRCRFFSMTAATTPFTPSILSEFHVPKLDRVQFVAQPVGDVQIKYVARANIDISIREKFQELLVAKCATRTKVHVGRVDGIAQDPKTGKVTLVEIRL